ncbi:unnamed protein product, partial [Didymodactylos carnosus]
YVLIQIGILIWIIVRPYTMIYVVHQQNMNPSIVTAKISAILLSFNAILMIILMLKRTITLVRSSYLRYVLPVGYHIDFHRWIGRYILVLAFIHALSHMIDFAIIKTRMCFLF